MENRCLEITERENYLFNIIDEDNDINISPALKIFREALENIENFEFLSDDEIDLMGKEDFYIYRLERKKKQNDAYAEALLIFLNSPDSLSVDWPSPLVIKSDDERLRIYSWFSNDDSNWQCDTIIQHIEGSEILDVVLVRDLINKYGLDYEFGIVGYENVTKIKENIDILSGSARARPHIYIEAKISIIIENGNISLYPVSDNEMGTYEYVNVIERLKYLYGE
jgi:hypothetical protein